MLKNKANRKYEPNTNLLASICWCLQIDQTYGVDYKSKGRRCARQCVGSEAGQELRADSRNVELEQLHPGPGDEVLAEEGAGVNREIRLHSLEQARWQELRIALGLHGQWDQADQDLAEQYLQRLQKHQR